MSLKQKAIKGVLWSAIQSWGSQAIAFIVFSLLARLLEPKTFGLIAMAGVFLAFIEVFLDQGFSNAIVQRQELEPEHLNTAFWTNLGIGMFMTVLSVATADLIATLFHQPELGSVIRWLSLSFIIRSLSAVQEAILTRNLAFKTLAIRSLIAVIASGVFGVAMALMGFGIWSLVGQKLINSLVQIVVLWWASDWRPKLNFSKKHFQDLFAFGINVIGINVLIFFNRRADDLLIGYFLGPVALGYYTIAYRILLVMIQLLGSVVGQVALPVFAKTQSEPQQMRKAFYQSTHIVSLIAVPVFLGTASLSPELIQICFGEQWLASIPVMQILCFVGIVNSVVSLTGSVIQACGKPSWSFLLGLINTPANLIGFAIGLKWGIIGVATAFSIRGYLFIPFPLLCVRKLIDIKLATYFLQYKNAIIASGLMIGVILASKYFLINLVEIHFYLAICIFMGWLSYTIAIVFLEPQLTQQAISQAKTMFGSQ
jgi:O-antigen/teichoic acid export membrane protein